MKQVMIIIVVIAAVAVVSITAVAQEKSTQEITNYSFAGDKDKYLIKEVKEITATILKPPKIPKGVSKKQALRIWNEGGEITEENCKTKYLSFAREISAKTLCEKKIIKKVSKNSLALEVEESKYQKPTSLWFYFLPLMSVLGILSLTMIFIAKKAPARFLIQEAIVQIAVMLLVIMVSFILTNHTLAPILLLIFVIDFCLIYAWEKGFWLTWKWTVQHPRLNCLTWQGYGLENAWFLGQLFTIIAIGLTMPTTIIRIEFIWWLFGWYLVCWLVLLACNQTKISKKFSWI